MSSYDLELQSLRSRDAMAEPQFQPTHPPAHRPCKYLPHEQLPGHPELPYYFPFTAEQLRRPRRVFTRGPMAAKPQPQPPAQPQPQSAFSPRATQDDSAWPLPKSPIEPAAKPAIPNPVTPPNCARKARKHVCFAEEVEIDDMRQPLVYERGQHPLRMNPSRRFSAPFGHK